MMVAPYVFFPGNCEEALAFYESALGAEISNVSRFADAPDPSMLPPGVPPENIMHSEMRIAGALVMASDGRHGEPAATVVSISLMTKDAAEARRWYDGLADGGTPAMPFGETFFSPGFGMLTDRFGVSWMVMTLPEEA